MKHALRFAALALAGLSACSSAPQPYADGSPGDDWPGFGRTYGEQHYSPLDQISAATVGRLGLAWSFDLPPGNPLSSPVEAQGMLYTATGYSVVRAFDVTTGKLLWEHDTGVAATASPRMRNAWGIRGLAWWDGKLYVGTQDGRLVAIDARSGQQVWSQQTLEPGMIASITAAPRIFDGKVIVGFGGGDYASIRGYVTAYDAETGKQLWRFYTVPGNPAVDHDETTRIAASSWTGQWWKLGGGGTAWNASTYDPETDTVFIGTGNGGPWNRRARSPGGGDNLFLCSIIALDAKTGKYKWHYQFNPGESWDYNAVMDMPLATLTIDGKPRKVIMEAPKNGFFYVIDRITGKLISAKPFTKVSWAKGIDLNTGRPQEDPDARYPDGKEFKLWPSPMGGHNWLPMATSARTGLVYIPTVNMAATFNDRGIDVQHYSRQPGSDNSNAVNVGYATPELLGEASAFIQAWDPATQKQVWKQPDLGVWAGGVLATGGGLVFQGQANGQFRALDDRTGKVLWTYDAKAPVFAPPISYRWQGRQYVSVITGSGTTLSLLDVGHKMGLQFATQPRRVLTFALDGKARLPANPAPAPLTAQPDPGFVADQAKWTAGIVTYHKNCATCHGFYAVGIGTAPDLRASAVPMSAATFRSVVHDGALISLGMPQFGQLSDADLDNIRHYLRARAKDLAAGK